MSVSDDDFAALFEASQKAKQYDRGQTIEGTIVAIGPAVAFIDVGGKGEAVMDVAELKNEDGEIEVAVGERIKAVVVSTSGGLTLSRKLVRGGGAGADRQLTDAFGAGVPVEGKVERDVKGGYEVRVGRQRGFCPMSQIDIVRTADPAVHVGRVYTFRIIEYKNDGKDLVLSRRALLDAELQAQADETRKAIVPGAVLKGRVVSVRDFGAFVDLGGVQGLLHVSDMGWSRVANTEQFISAGEEITVKVLRVDEDTQKISLGVKQLSEDPWLSVATTFEVGQVRTGRVTRLADFGAFVELEPGIEGLAHVSTFQPTGRQDGWKGFVTAGATATFEILTIDADKRRIGVALVQEGVTHAAPAPTSSPRGDIVVGARVTGTVDRHEPYGVFVFLAPGRTGLMPLAETGVAKEGDVTKAFPVGSKIEVMVLEIDPSGRRIRVSRKAMLDAQDAAELREYRERSEADAPRQVGSLADQLRGALSSPRSR